MKDRDKLRVLIPHWIEHNQEHAEEFRRWSESADEVAGDILDAATAMDRVNDALKTALEKLGGPLPHDQLHHHGHQESE
jgi:hypothetical protein